MAKRKTPVKRTSKKKAKIENPSNEDERTSDNDSIDRKNVPSTSKTTARDRKKQRKEAAKVRMQVNRDSQTQEEREARLESDAQKSVARRSQQSKKEKAQEYKKNVRRNSESRANESKKTKDSRRRSVAERAAAKRERATLEERNEERLKNSRKMAESRASAPESVKKSRKSKDKSRKSARKGANLGIAGSDDRPERHYLGLLNIECEHCGAEYYKNEATTTGKYNKCCKSGSVEVNMFENFPAELEELYTSDNPDALHFRDNSRQYNNSIALASMKAQLDVPKGGGPYCYKLHGQTYHMVGPFRPQSGEQHQFAQVFILDTAQAAEELAGRPMNKNCTKEVFDLIIGILKRDNRHVQAYLMMREVDDNEMAEALRENRAVREVHMTFRTNGADDQRRYQLPTASEVAVVYVGDEDEIPGEHGITIHSRSGNMQFLKDIDCRCDPFKYPLLFPTGSFGWHPNFTYAKAQGGKRIRVSQREFYAFLLHSRASFSPLFSAGKLFQQYIVDVWTRIEQNRLQYYRSNPDEFRIETLQGLQDFMAGDQSGGTGTRVKLPASHIGSPRNMVAQYQDAMAIVSRYGKPDYFLTMTCNSDWPEIKEQLLPGQTASDIIIDIC